MPDRDRLNRWCVVRLLPNMQRIVVARCRTESDADGHAQILRHLLPQGEFLVVFDGELDIPDRLEADLQLDRSLPTRPLPWQ